MTYYMYNSIGCSIPYHGTNLINAISANFESICRELRVGNLAGYRMHSATLHYEPGILGGKGGAVLTINAYGSKGLIGYDPDRDPLKQYVAWFEYIKPEEIPETYEFQILRDFNR